MEHMDTKEPHERGKREDLIDNNDGTETCKCGCGSTYLKEDSLKVTSGGIPIPFKFEKGLLNYKSDWMKRDALP